MAAPVLHEHETPVADFGDVRGEFAAMHSACGVYDLARAKIALTGNDRVRWLNGMVTNNVRDLAVDHGVYAFLLNPQGHILADLYAYQRGDSLLIDCARAHVQKILELFDHYIIMDDVEVADVSEQLAAVGIAGPKAHDVVRAAGFERNLESLQVANAMWRDHAVTVVKMDNPGVEAYELWPAPGDKAALWEALVKAGAKPVGASALELSRIASGVPRYGQDIRERDLPQETEQDRALNFSKGCYIGQEIVERIRSRGQVHRKFTGFVVEGALPAPGTKIQAEGKDVGEITSAASLPTAGGERGVALGYLRRELAVAGKQVEAGGKLTVANLPFADIT